MVVIGIIFLAIEQWGSKSPEKPADPHKRLSRGSGNNRKGVENVGLEIIHNKQFQFSPAKGNENGRECG